MAKKLRSKLTSVLPHVELPVPYRLAPDQVLNVYLDSELGIPLNFREPDAIETFLENCSQYSCILDVGAHIGTYSILATKYPFTSVHSFEPHPKNVKRLRKNIRANEVGNRVKVVPKAVSDFNGSTKLLEQDGDMAHRIDENDRKDGIIVETITIDTYCQKEEIHPSFLKIDAEGAGDAVLKGASSVIERDSPDILFEAHDDSEECTFKEIVEGCDYHTTRLDGDHWFATS
jgi:FkbM family methyltransferase